MDRLHTYRLLRDQRNRIAVLVVAWLLATLPALISRQDIRQPQSTTPPAQETVVPTHGDQVTKFTP